MIRVAAIAMALAAQCANAAPSEMTLAITEFDLANGLHVIVQEDHSAPLVAVDVRFHVGSKNEVAGKTGFAHLFEHLMFDGSKNVGRLMFDKYLTNVGAQNNAYTTSDETNYHEVVPVNQLELVLWLESDRMMQFAIGPPSLKTQKSVVKEEKRETDDNRPYGSLEEKMHSLAYQDSGCYSWPVIGSMKDIDAAKMNDVRDFFETYYVPNNAVLCLAGDITADDARRLVTQWFGDIPRGTKPFTRPTLNVARQADARSITIPDDVPTPAVFATFHAPGESTDDSYALDLLSMILGSGESSRLNHRLVYEQQIASEASSYVDDGELGSLFYVYAIGAKPDEDVAVLERDMYAIVDAVISNGVTERELTKVKNAKEWSLIQAVSTAMGRADVLTHAHVMLGGADKLGVQIEKYNRITVDDISRVAKKYLAPELRNVVKYVPKKGK